MALSLQQEQQVSELGWEQLPEGISDLELAKKLQEEEDRRASEFYQEQEEEQEQAAAAAQAQVQIHIHSHTCAQVTKGKAILKGLVNTTSSPNSFSTTWQILQDCRDEHWSCSIEQGFSAFSTIRPTYSYL